MPEVAIAEDRDLPIHEDEVRAARADRRAADLADKIEELREAGATSLRDLADGLTADPTARTPRGRDDWHPTQVQRVLGRLGADLMSASNRAR